MILPFSTHFPNGKPTYFVPKIIGSYSLIFNDYTIFNLIKGKSSEDEFKDICKQIFYSTKIHSLRLDKSNRWKAGNLIHFYLWNRTKRATCFAVTKCKAIEYAIIEPHLKQVRVASINELGIVNRLLSPKELDQFMTNDGFDCAEDFWAFFTESETYKIIHWTNYRYV